VMIWIIKFMRGLFVCLGVDIVLIHLKSTILSLGTGGFP